MATLAGPFGFEGKLGSLSAYRRTGISKTILRVKGGPSRNKVKRSPVFARTRALNNEFSGATQAGSAFRTLLEQLRVVADHNISAPITAIIKKIQGCDEAHETGFRSILFSQHDYLLQGFQLNRKTSLEQMIPGPIQVQASRTTGIIQVDIPALNPDKTFFPASGQSLFSLVVTAGWIPDWHASDKGSYAPVGNALIRDFQSPWHFTANALEAQQIELKLPSPGKQKEAYGLCIAIGLRFGTRITDVLVKESKYVGAGKVVTVV
ncbi:MAG: hypothetical protein GXC72_05165 [Chitinophagaceae bacterium]|nr:hypothetical protein [Chitinophagaceae bacterium]